MRSLKLPLLILSGCIFLFTAKAQRNDVNYDEPAAGNLPLPELLSNDNAGKITTAAAWEKNRRKTILKNFTHEVYGRIPGKPSGMRFEVLDEKTVFNGKAIRKQIDIILGKEENSPRMHILLYLPAKREKVPVFVGLNFKGNHSVEDDSGIIISQEYRALNPSATDLPRGVQKERWPVEAIIDRGYGVATAWYQELEADHPEGYKTGIRTTLAKTLKIKKHEWGAIAAWAWGLMRIADMLEGEPLADQNRLIITGHSRLGKACLWAAANDLRFDMVISNNSGEGGAALARRNYGETVSIINTSFPHWFVDNYKKYNNAVASLPVDQHMLLAAMAPRPLYVTSATEDLWADPRGEFLAAKLAGEVYNLYGKKGIETEMPGPDSPVGASVRYHVRTGKHDMTRYDWEQFMHFADEIWLKQR